MQVDVQKKSLIKQNILLFLSDIGMSQYDFYKKTGITRGILAQDNGISEDNISKFLAYFPEVNPAWLITGCGDMITKGANVGIVEQVQDESQAIQINGINARFKKIIGALYGGNKSAFAAAIGISPTVIENVVGRRQGKPSFDVIEKVCALANVNTEWLITGKGDPFDFSDKPNDIQPAPETEISGRIFDMIIEKDAMIREQAEQIGALKERIAQLERGKGRDASDAHTSNIANVG